MQATKNNEAKMKVTVIGGGSTYTPELVKGLIDLSGSFPLNELTLMDIDTQRLEIVGGFVNRLVSAANADFKAVLTDDRRAAIKDADYVITQFRVGQMEARIQDEYLGKRHGLVGQETTGVGGMAKALRTIPVILEIADEIQELAPNALLVNFTNPAGLITEALSIHRPEIQAVGMCNVAITTKMSLLKELQGQDGPEIDPNYAQLDTLGLNHLTWHRGFSIDGKDVWDQVFSQFLKNLQEEAKPEWDPLTIEALGLIPNYYLQYFYHTGKKIGQQEQWPPSRGEQVKEIEARLLELYADPNLEQVPEDLMERGGAWYSTMAAQLLNAHFNNLNEIHVANVRHNGAVESWPEDWVLEMPSRVSRQGIVPIPAEPLPDVCFGLVAAVKAYEIYTARAAMSGDRNTARLALLAHPLGPDASKIEAVLDDLLTTNKDFLPNFILRN
jgi:6-phospho-beta-glucosidase